MIEGLKPRFNALLRPLVAPFAAIGVHPNHLTIAGVLFFAGGAVFAQKGSWKTALWFIAIGGILDGLDGVLARETGKKTVFGAILDSCCDRLTEIFLLFGVLGYFLSAPVISFSKASLSLHERAWGVVFCYAAITMSLMISYVKARCEAEGIVCNHGILQRPERIILFCTGIFFGPRTMLWILGAISILGGITVIQRFYEAYRGVKKQCDVRR
jgi:CDP-diacylglycerol--glycerol-3-phosphate 3-phosphatidyltransferase